MYIFYILLVIPFTDYCSIILVYETHSNQIVLKHCSPNKKNIIKNKVLTIKCQEFKTCLTTLNSAPTPFLKAGKFPSLQFIRYNFIFLTNVKPTNKCNKITMRLRTNQQSYAHKHSHGIYKSTKIQEIHFTLTLI